MNKFRSIFFFLKLLEMVGGPSPKTLTPEVVLGPKEDQPNCYRVIGHMKSLSKKRLRDRVCLTSDLLKNKITLNISMNRFTWCISHL